MSSNPIKPDSSTEETNPAAENNPATPETPMEESREDRLMSFSRRAILHAGWAIPTVLAIGLPKNVLAQSAPFPTGDHTDGSIHIDVVGPITPPETLANSHNDHGDAALHDDYVNTYPIIIFVPPSPLTANHHWDGSHVDGGASVHLDSLVDAIGDHTDGADHVDASGTPRDELIVTNSDPTNYDVIHYDSTSSGVLVVDHFDSPPPGP